MNTVYHSNTAVVSPLTLWVSAATFALYTYEPNNNTALTMCAGLAAALGLCLAVASALSSVQQLRRLNENVMPFAPGVVLLFAAATLWLYGTAKSEWPFQHLALPYIILVIAVAGAQHVLFALTQAGRGLPLSAAGQGFVRSYRISPDKQELFKRRMQSSSNPRTQQADPKPKGSSNNGNNSNNDGNSKSNNNKVKNRATEPSVSFDKLYGGADVKEKLITAVNEWNERGKNGVLLFGPPGTGKTVFAEAMAHYAGLKFLKVDFSSIASRWINQSTEQVAEVFDDAGRQQPVLLFIDEVDALLKERDGSGYQPEEYNRLVTTFLTKSVELRSKRVLLVLATNHADRLDSAAMRDGRIDHRIEVTLPDAEARRGLIEATLRKQNCLTPEAELARLVRRWAGLNVPRILNVTEDACMMAREAAGRIDVDPEAQPVAVTYAHYYAALRKAQGRKGGAPEGAKSFADLYMDAEQKDKLLDIAQQLINTDTLEEAGGGLPKGVLFYGPPGTGKTATAMALARESGWSFIQRSGRELMKSDEIDKLRKEASDLRPAIVFIDEADDILGNRQLSGNKALTNELLILIDGAEGMLQDVVWVAATNHPDNLDSAARRGGRFGKKIAFQPLDEAITKRLIRDWATAKIEANALAIDGTPETWAQAIYPAMRDMTPSDIYEALNAANNTAIIRHIRLGEDRTVTLERIADAVEELSVQ